VYSCYPAHISDRISSPSYKRRMEGGGLSFRERQRTRVVCDLCDKELAKGSLNTHKRTVHGVSALRGNLGPEPPERAPDSYRVSFPAGVHGVECPVEDCPGTATTRDNLRSHFAHRHPRDSLCILEEGRYPHPKCNRCGMHVSLLAMGQGHQNSQRCRKGAARLRQRAAIQAARAAREVVFTIYGDNLDSVDTFKYLGRPISAVDDDWPALHRNLTKARQRWGQVRRILAREGADPRVSAMFYKAIVQSVLLYGCETWTISPAMLKALRGFHHRVARRLTGKMPHRRGNGEWVYPPIEEAFELAGMFSIEHYINVRQRTLLQAVATRPVLELCREVERPSGSTRSMGWWEQPQIFDLLLNGEVEDDSD